VAIALVTVYFSFRYLRKIRWLHLVFAVLLCLSTVYCRYHYAVDVFAGALTAAVLLPLGNWLYWKYGARQPASVPGSNLAPESHLSLPERD
jgi:membrane-associated phospholipid phosphatase